MGGVSILQDERRSVAGAGDGCTTMLMYLTPLNCALKMVNLVNFMCILPQLKKIFFQRYPFQEKW